MTTLMNYQLKKNCLGVVLNVLLQKIYLFIVLYYILENFQLSNVVSNDLEIVPSQGFNQFVTECNST